MVNLGYRASLDIILVWATCDDQGTYFVQYVPALVGIACGLYGISSSTSGSVIRAGTRPGSIRTFNRILNAARRGLAVDLPPPPPPRVMSLCCLGPQTCLGSSEVPLPGNQNIVDWQDCPPVCTAFIIIIYTPSDGRETSTPYLNTDPKTGCISTRKTYHFAQAPMTNSGLLVQDTGNPMHFLKYAAAFAAVIITGVGGAPIPALLPDIHTIQVRAPTLWEEDGFWHGF